jgi:hypothetical protein
MDGKCTNFSAILGAEPENCRKNHTRSMEGCVLRVGGDLVGFGPGEDEEQRQEGSGSQYKARLVRAGEVRARGGTRSGMVVTREALLDGLRRGLFSGLAMFVDHPDWFEHPKVRRLVGVTGASWWNEGNQAVEARFKFYGTHLAREVQAIIEGMFADQARGEPVPDVGLSLVFWPQWKPREDLDEDLVLESIRHIESVDFVFQPAADGRILEKLSSLFVGGKAMEGKCEKIEEYEGEVAPAPVVGNDPPLEEGFSKDGVMDALKALQTQVDSLSAKLIRAEEDEAVDLGGRPPRSPSIHVGLSGFGELQAAAEALFMAEKPANGVRPLSGIRELYTLLTGDYEMTGLYQGERVMFANVTSSIMAGLAANALNKTVVNRWAEFPKWWAPAVTVEDFSSMQDARWVSLGGVGELPTVSEGATYSELTWDDQTETDSFVKKGGYLGITLEVIDKDDTRKVQAAPRALAQAAWLTLGKTIAAVFTANSGYGVAMSDSNNLFDSSNHANQGSTALSFSAWEATRVAMMKHTEINSSERLGALTAPYLLWVPVDLEIPGLQILMSAGETGTANNDENPFASGIDREERLRSARARLVVCPFWTDTNDWVAQADPRLYPGLGLGFRYGRTPEIFSVASPTAGLMFTNDVMPVKVRFIFAVGPTDWRGWYKHLVS